MMVLLRWRPVQLIEMQINIITQDSPFRFCFYPRVSFMLLQRHSCSSFRRFRDKNFKKSTVTFAISISPSVSQNYTVVLKASKLPFSPPNYTARNFRVNLYFYDDMRQQNLPQWIARRHQPPRQALNHRAVLFAVIVWIKRLYLWENFVFSEH
jgi:hypothetical protein